MAQGKSGRIVIDVDPEFKQEVYRALAQQGSTLKDWFLEEANRLCQETKQPELGLGVRYVQTSKNIKEINAHDPN